MEMRDLNKELEERGLVHIHGALDLAKDKYALFPISHATFHRIDHLLVNIPESIRLQKQKTYQCFFSIDAVKVGLTLKGKSENTPTSGVWTTYL